MENNKTCSKCGEEKTVDFFYNDITKKDGKRRDCKDCQNASQGEYRKTKKGRALMRKAIKKYKQTEAGKLSNRRCSKRRHEKYPERSAAINSVRRAVRSGELKKPSYCCVDSSECNGRIEGHHWDYSRPLDVTWLCHKHHTWVHQNEASK